MRLLLPLLCAVAMVAGESDYQPMDQDAMLGVPMTPTSNAAQVANGLDPHQGVETQGTYPGTAAERMGIKNGDVITSINGSPINSMTDLRNEVSLIGVGGSATVEVMRNGRKLTMTDNLSAWPKNIPREPIDEAAERRFRDWQSRRLDRTQQAVTNLRKQVEDIERRANARPAQGSTPLSPVQALQLPASEALALLPAFKVTVNLAHDALNASDAEPGTPVRDVAWDARVLIGTPPATIL